MPDETRNDDEQGEVTEPANSTVEDWMGQGIARDEEVADRAVAESDTMEEAEARYDEEADGQQAHEEGYPRPAEEGQDPDGPVGQPS